MGNKYHIYSTQLEEVVKRYGYIPRKFKKEERLRLYHRYWFNYFDDIIKVVQVEYINNIEYYFLKIGKNMAACTPYPITFYENGYELLYNHTSIENQNIINSDKSYSGAEIKFWFCKNNINFDNDTYKGFWPFVNPNSKNVVVDNKYYFVVNDKFRRQQFQVILDKSKIPR